MAFVMGGAVAGSHVLFSQASGARSLVPSTVLSGKGRGGVALLGGRHGMSVATTRPSLPRAVAASRSRRNFAGEDSKSKLDLVGFAMCNGTGKGVVGDTDHGWAWDNVIDGKVPSLFGFNDNLAASMFGVDANGSKISLGVLVQIMAIKTSTIVQETHVPTIFPEKERQLLRTKFRTLGDTSLALVGKINKGDLTEDDAARALIRVHSNIVLHSHELFQAFKQSFPNYPSRHEMLAHYKPKISKLCSSAEEIDTYEDLMYVMFRTEMVLREFRKIDGGDA